MTDLADAAAERGIRYFLISFVDLFGHLRAKLVPAAAIAGMQRNGAGFGGFAAWFDLRPSDPDMIAVPDPDSLIQLPWKPEVGWLASDLFLRGAPLAQAPRHVLRAQIARAAAAGYAMKTGVECEYFLIAPDGAAIADAADRAEKPCYDQAALMRRYDVVTEICDAMRSLGWNPYQNDHEDANGQFEMNWLFDDALTTADRHVFFKFMVKSIAEQHGLRATFMPKPFAGLTGSGCHAHVSVWRDQDNLFLDETDAVGLSPLAQRFLGGVLHHAPALCALLNPVVNSYKRINARPTLSGATWSPNAISWSGDNRTHMVRVPAAGRFELRLADGAANPYLLQAGILAAGLDGIVESRDPGPRLDIDMYTEMHTIPAPRRLPLNLLDALRELETSGPLRAALGADFVSAFLRLKYAQWNDYAHHLTQWERDTTLDI